MSSGGYVCVRVLLVAFELFWGDCVSDCCCGLCVEMLCVCLCDCDVCVYCVSVEFVCDGFGVLML